MSFRPERQRCEAFCVAQFVRILVPPSVSVKNASQRFRKVLASVRSFSRKRHCSLLQVATRSALSTRRHLPFEPWSATFRWKISESFLSRMIECYLFGTNSQLCMGVPCSPTNNQMSWRYRGRFQQERIVYASFYIRNSQSISKL